MIDAASRFPTQMGREIGQIPAAVQRVLDEPGQLADVAAAIERAAPRWIMIAGRGTSDHAAVFAQYLFETHLGLPTGLVKPSVTTVYGASLDWRGGLVLAISQSGQSPDVVAVVEVPSRIDRDGAHPIRQPAMQPAMRDLVRAVKAYERLAIRAAESGERADVRAALEAHPLVGGRIGDVDPLLDALLEANRPYLPQFGAVT